jgi:hypothetical protein
MIEEYAMSDQYLLEVYRQQRTHQEKYIYFILAAAASAIAYALNRAQDRSLTLILIPWGIALMLWGLSFYFGCRHLNQIDTIMFQNIEGLKIEAGINPKIGNHPAAIAVAVAEFEKIMAAESKKAHLLARLQFWLFVAGVVAYIVWQLIEMYARSV